MYAREFEATGGDVTQRWETAEEQTAALQDIYNKGYEDGFYERQRRLQISGLTERGVNDKEGSEKGVKTDKGNGEGHKGGGIRNRAFNDGSHKDDA